MICTFTCLYYCTGLIHCFAGLFVPGNLQLPAGESETLYCILQTTYSVSTESFCERLSWYDVEGNYHAIDYLSVDNELIKNIRVFITPGPLLLGFAVVPEEQQTCEATKAMTLTEGIPLDHNYKTAMNFEFASSEPSWNKYDCKFTDVDANTVLSSENTVTVYVYDNSEGNSKSFNSKNPS